MGSLELGTLKSVEASYNQFEMFKLIGFFSLILATTNGASFISAELEVTLKLSPQAQNEETRSEVSVFKNLEKEIKQDCPGPECPGGCCPHVGWVCCPDGEHCAATEEYCNKADFAKILMSMAAPKRLSNKIALDLYA